MLDSSSNSRRMSPASLPSTSHPTLLPGSRYNKQRQQPRDVHLSGIAKDRSQSAGSSWEAEFARYSDAEHLQKASQHLELTWKVAKVPISPSFASPIHFANNMMLMLTQKCKQYHAKPLSCCRMQSLLPAHTVKDKAVSHAPGATQQVRAFPLPYLISGTMPVLILCLS